MSDADAAVFEAERARLTGLAYRLLGSVSDAEDVVQDAWLRWQAADRATIDSPPAWSPRWCHGSASTACGSAAATRSGMWAPGCPSRWSVRCWRIAPTRRCRRTLPRWPPSPTR